MENPYLTFQKFNDAGLAEVVAGKLKELHIEFELENEQPNFDPSYAFNHVEPTIHLKIQANDFPKAQTVLEEYYEGHLQDVDPDYYLLSFSNRELQEIIEKPYEWGHFDSYSVRRQRSGRLPLADSAFRQPCLCQSDSRGPQAPPYTAQQTPTTDR